MENNYQPPTYLQQEKHIHEQYIAGLIHPYYNKDCICGNMLGRRLDPATLTEKQRTDNSRQRFWPLGDYTEWELSRIEHAFLRPISALDFIVEVAIRAHPDYEDALFEGMIEGLKVLRQIHIDRGENVEEVPINFIKRQKPVFNNNFQ